MNRPTFNSIEEAQPKMDIYFAVFNQHINDAKEKATADLIKEFGQEMYDSDFLPFVEKGIMSIFKTPPTNITMFYAERVQHYVNEGRV